MNELTPPDTPVDRLRLLLRRLAALFYDLVVLSGLLIILTFPFLGATVQITGSDSIPTGNPVYQVYLSLITAAYFVTSWHFGGQTLGMRAWRLCAINAHGHPLSWRQSAARAAAGLPGLLLGGIGYWYALIDREGRTAGERLSATYTGVLPKQRRTKF